MPLTIRRVYKRFELTWILSDSLKLQPAHVYEVRPRKDRRGFDLISDALAFGRLWYAGPDAASNAVRYAKFNSRKAHSAVAINQLEYRRICTYFLSPIPFTFFKSSALRNGRAAIIR